MALTRAERASPDGSGHELGQAHEIVGRGGEGQGEADAARPPEPGLRLPGHRLYPTERLLDALADALAHQIAAMSCRAPVDRRTSAIGVLRHMRRHVDRAKLVDEVLRVI